jgi:hypothetical protein
MSAVLVGLGLADPQGDDRFIYVLRLEQGGHQEPRSGIRHLRGL